MSNMNLANKFLDPIKELIVSLIKEGKICPICYKCDHKLDTVQHFNLFCHRCGDISAFEDKILYRPIIKF